MGNSIKEPDLNVTDLTVSKIVTADFITTDNWKRPLAFMRPNNGIVFFTSGSIKYFFDNETVTACEGDILCLPKDLNYSGMKLYNNKSNSFYVVDFFTAKEKEFEHFPLPFVFHANSRSVIEEKFRELTNLFSGADINNLSCKAKLYELLDIILKDYYSSNKPKNLEKFTEISGFIKKNYQNSSLNIDMLCEEFYISESGLRRLFAKMCNMPPVTYINNIRINAAKNLLLYDNISVANISVRCGFSSLYYFSRIFKKITGKSPTEYRR